MRHIAILAALALAGCGTTPAEQAQLAAAGQTLASVAAAHNTTVASLVTKGNLFCQQKVVTGAPLIVALANLYGAPVSVVNQTAADVATACALVGGIPVAPPVDPASAPVVTAPVAVLPAA